MEHIYVVLGANFGDEGKGRIANKIARDSSNDGKTGLNVLFNGGCQRGHTVGFGKDRKVFHCFGSASDFYHTYWHQDFMVDPIAVAIEMPIYRKDCIYADPMCRIVTPYDAAANRRKESLRGINRHGSCGMGILETRNRSKEIPISLMDISDPYLLYAKLRLVRDYYAEKDPEILNDVSFTDDDFMVASQLTYEKISAVTDQEVLFKKYDCIIYEGGQGLLLSEDNMQYFPYLTPSYTGSQIISREINQTDLPVDVHYVTRTYLTRHGAGPLLYECRKEEINEKIEDSTNRSNEYQGSLRYAYHNPDDLLARTAKDFSRYKGKAKKILDVTHCDYTDEKFACNKDRSLWIPITYLAQYFDKINLYSKEG